MIALGALIILVAIAGLFVISGFERVPDDKENPQFGVISNLFTGYTNKTAGPGHLIWKMPFIEKLILEDATIEDIVITIDDIVSRDNLEMKAVCRISYKADYERSDNHIKNYFLSGRKTKINQRLTGGVRGCLRNYINQHNATVCEKTSDQATEELIVSATTLSRDEALEKINKPDDGIPDIEGMGIIITRLSVESIIITDEKVRRAREAPTRERMLRQARKARAKTFNETVEERKKALESTTNPEERRKLEQQYVEERNWDLAEGGHGQVIIAPQGTSVIVDGRQSSKPSQKKNRKGDSDE